MSYGQSTIIYRTVISKNLQTLRVVKRFQALFKRISSVLKPCKQLSDITVRDIVNPPYEA